MVDPYAGKSFASLRRFFGKYPKMIPICTIAGVGVVAYTGLFVYGNATITDIPLPDKPDGPSEAIQALEKTKSIIMQQQMKHLQGTDVQQLRADIYSPK